MIHTLITESSRTCYGNDHGTVTHLVAPSRAPASRAFWNGLEWNGMEGSLKLTSGLWLLVVETLIFNIISQRARPMMTKNTGPSPTEPVARRLLDLIHFRTNDVVVSGFIAAVLCPGRYVVRCELGPYVEVREEEIL